VTKAILDAGYEWEEQVVGKYLKGRVRVRPGKEKLRDRTFSAEETLRALKSLKPAQAVYQPTLNPPKAFLERYGLDPDLVEFRPCRPDLIVAEKEGSGKHLRVVDVKASTALKSSHRVQVGLYSMILRDVLDEAGLDLEIDADTAGVWLYRQGDPETFELDTTTSALETFLRDKLMDILERPVDELG
jgi:predicted RecB family nuclease